MAVIAVPGGTTGVGRAIAEGIKAKGKHEVIILSRNSNPKLEAEIGLRIIPANYADEASLTKLFNDLKVHTVISTVKNDGFPDTDMSLIKASEAAPSVKRFIPSLWASPLTEEQFRAFPAIQAKLDTFEYLKKTNLEATVVYIGFFMDYWGSPGYPTYLPFFPLAVDIPNNFAAIPGTGNEKIWMTHSFTIGKFIAEYLDLPKWTTWEAHMIGDNVTFNEMVSLAEKIKGKKFSVTYDSVETLKEGKYTELPSQVGQDKKTIDGMISTLSLWFADGSFDITPAQIPENSFNQWFPEVHVLTVKEMFEVAWSGKA